MYKKGRVNSNSRIISTDEDPSLRIESSAIINLRGVSTKLNKYNFVLHPFPCYWGVIDGCHIPLKSPAGGMEAC